MPRHLSTVNQARWARFRQNRRGFWSLWIFLVVFTLALLSDVLANDKPLLAQLSRYEAQLKLAEDRVYRQSALLEKDAVSQEAYEQARTELAMLNADIDIVRSNIALTELHAPFDGVIGLRNVSEGAYASPSVVVARA